MHGIKVGRRHAEEVRKELMKTGLLDTDYKIISTKRNVTFPVTSIPGQIPHGEPVDGDFEPRGRRKAFRQLLQASLTEQEMALLGRSFDIIGEIAILEIPPELEKHSPKIAEALMEAHKSVRTVYSKSGAISGEERVRKLEFLGGIHRSETVHRESGCELKLDVEKVYFSPRLSHERERVLSLAEDGETVVDLFAGIGPFSILLAKNREVEVHAIDSNPAAYHYLEENIRVNKVVDRVIPLLGDCREVAPRGVADRVIMNLPLRSHEFLGLALEVIKAGTVHLYTVAKDDSEPEVIKEAAKAKGRSAEVAASRMVRSYSPGKYHVVFDIEIE